MARADVEVFHVTAGQGQERGDLGAALGDPHVELGEDGLRHPTIGLVDGSDFGQVRHRVAARLEKERRHRIRIARARAPDPYIAHGPTGAISTRPAHPIQAPTGAGAVHAPDGPGRRCILLPSRASGGTLGR